MENHLTNNKSEINTGNISAWPSKALPILDNAALQTTKDKNWKKGKDE